MVATSLAKEGVMGSGGMVRMKKMMLRGLSGAVPAAAEATARYNARRTRFLSTALFAVFLDTTAAARIFIVSPGTAFAVRKTPRAPTPRFSISSTSFVRRRRCAGSIEWGLLESDAGAALLAAALDDGATSRGAGLHQKTMRCRALPLLRLIRSFHWDTI